MQTQFPNICLIQDSRQYIMAPDATLIIVKDYREPGA